MKRRKEYDYAQDLWDNLEVCNEDRLFPFEGLALVRKVQR